MNLQIKKEAGVVYDPVFLKILEDIPGGITVKTDRFPTDVRIVKKGALLSASASSIGLYNVIKTVRNTARVENTATIIAIEPKDHLFEVGEYFSAGSGMGAGEIARVSITAIAAVAAIGGQGIATDTVLYETLENKVAIKYVADAILRDTIKVRDEEGNLLDNIFAGAVVRGTVDESELPYFITDGDKDALTVRIRFA